MIDEETSVFLLIGEGGSRSNDERAARFLKEFGGSKVFQLDARDIGLNQFDPKVSEHFNHLLFSNLKQCIYEGIGLPDQKGLYDTYLYVESTIQLIKKALSRSNSIC